MTDDRTSSSARTPVAPAESIAGRGSHPLWRAFWLAFLVLSLGYAWYSFYAPANDIAWADDYAAGTREAHASQRPLLLFFTGQWCSPCQIMKRQVWADAQVRAAVDDGFVPVQIDVGDPDAVQVVARFGVGITPTTIVADPAGNVLHQVPGRMSRDDVLALLDRLD